MKLKVFYNRILASLLKSLGFASVCLISSCKTDYGVPVADYIVNGNVRDSITGKAIQNIRVSMLQDTTRSDPSGNFSLDAIGPNYLRIHFADTDDSLNGSYENKDTAIIFPNENYKEPNIADIKVVLKPKP